MDRPATNGDHEHRSEEKKERDRLPRASYKQLQRCCEGERDRVDEDGSVALFVAETLEFIRPDDALFSPLTLCLSISSSLTIYRLTRDTYSGSGHETQTTNPVLFDRLRRYKVV